MLTGRVTAEREAVLTVEILGSAGKAELVEATVDTGYNGYLTLPAGTVSDLGLPFAGTARAALGDGREVTLELFIARIRWHDGPRDVLVLQAEGGVLLGMAALEGSRVSLDVVHDGPVAIVPL